MELFKGLHYLGLVLKVVDWSFVLGNGLEQAIGVRGLVILDELDDLVLTTAGAS
jgi:hypothetical protein